MSNRIPAAEINWNRVKAAIVATSAKNVRVADYRESSEALYGNDGMVLSVNPFIALGYVESDWDACACRATR